MEDVGNKRFKSIFGIETVLLGAVVISLPLFGLVACVILSLLYDFESSTATHCRVGRLYFFCAGYSVCNHGNYYIQTAIVIASDRARSEVRRLTEEKLLLQDLMPIHLTTISQVANYLPSVSSAIGGYTPQRYIWRVCIALHCSPRFIAVACYYNSFRQRQVQTCRWIYHVLVTLNMLLSVIENFCLLLLTCISSTENYSAHETSFITFLVCSEFYMLFSLILCWWSKPSKEMSSKEWFSLKMKRVFFIINLISCAAVAYFFNRHNTYCEPGVYSLFALSEYTVVISNILFHGMAVVDFGDGKIMYVHNSMWLTDKSL